MNPHILAKFKIPWVILGLSAVVLSIGMIEFGCQGPKRAVRIHAAQGNPPIFDFRTGQLNPLRFQYIFENTVYMTQFEVYQIDEVRHVRDIYWQIETIPGVYTTETPRKKYYPDFIEYGKLPVGWRQRVPPKMLTDGAYGITGRLTFVKTGNQYRVLRERYQQELSNHH